MPRRGVAVHPVSQLHPVPRSQRCLPIDPGGPAASVELGHPAHADQRVGPGPQHQFLQVPDRARYPSRAAVKIRCRKRRTFSSCRRQSMPSQPRVSSSGPFTIGVQLVLWFRRFRLLAFTAHLPMSAPLSGPGPKPGIRPVIQERPPGGAALASWFPADFHPRLAFTRRRECRLRHGRHSLFGTSCSRPGTPRSLRSAYQTAPMRPGPGRVGSGQSAVPVFRPARFPDPPSAPGVPITEHRALRKPRCISRRSSCCARPRFGDLPSPVAVALGAHRGRVE